MKDFHLPLHSRSVFSRIGVVPAHKNHENQRTTGPPKEVLPAHPQKLVDGFSRFSRERGNRALVIVL